MTDVDKVAFAVGWYELRQCPGCFAPLEDVAGVGRGHWLPGSQVTTSKRAYPRTTVLGETFDGGNVDASDSRVCSWSSDDLAALVHIGSGLVRHADS